MTAMNFYGQWDPQTDKVILENYFQDKIDGFFIEAGAGDGVTDNNTKVLEDLGWKGINIEPVTENFILLEKYRPNATNIQVGLSNYDGEADFEVATRPDHGLMAGGAIDYLPKLKSEVGGFGYVFLPCKIPVTTYDTLIKKYNVDNVDLFVLDVEGQEIKVFETMTKVLPKVICVEYTITRLDPVMDILLKKGYRYDFVSFNNAFFSIGMENKTSWFGSTDVWHWR